MAREGIYINGKEIVARNVGYSVVWQKNTELLLATITTDTRWITVKSKNPRAVTRFRKRNVYNSNTYIRSNRIKVDDRVWKIHHVGFYCKFAQNSYISHIDIFFLNQKERDDFVRFANSKISIELKFYREKI